MAHGKSTVVKAISGVQVMWFPNILNVWRSCPFLCITFMLGVVFVFIWSIYSTYFLYSGAMTSFWVHFMWTCLNLYGTLPDVHQSPTKRGNTSDDIVINNVLQFWVFNLEKNIIKRMCHLLLDRNLVFAESCFIYFSNSKSVIFEAVISCYCCYMFCVLILELLCF